MVIDDKVRHSDTVSRNLRVSRYIGWIISLSPQFDASCLVRSFVAPGNY